jgi:hypothetical protein
MSTDVRSDGKNNLNKDIAIIFVIARISIRKGREISILL